MTCWLTSDQHFGHAAIIKHCLRPFANVQEMDLALIQNFNRLVGQYDTTYHLGDFAWNAQSTPLYLSRLNGKHHLVPGNHDACHPRKRKQLSKYAGFTLEPYATTIDGLCATHMPPTEAEDPRYPEYRPDATKHDVVLHGHVHELWKTKWVGECLCVNVGVDVWDFHPVSLRKIRKIVLDHHPGIL